MTVPFPYLLLPSIWSSRNRLRRSGRADVVRAGVFGGVAVVVCAALFAGSFWLTSRLDEYEELGDFLLRRGFGYETAGSVARRLWSEEHGTSEDDEAVPIEETLDSTE